jgi:hypothetical protein
MAQNKITVPENLSNLTVEIPTPVPIPELPPELFAVIFPLIIARFETIEAPSY